MTFNISDEMKTVLNHNAIDVSKESCCNQLLLNLNIVNDKDVHNLLVDTVSFLNNLSDIEYKELQNFLPFDLNINDDDIDTDFEN